MAAPWSLLTLLVLSLKYSSIPCGQCFAESRNLYTAGSLNNEDLGQHCQYSKWATGWMWVFKVDFWGGQIYFWFQTFAVFWMLYVFFWLFFGIWILYADVSEHCSNFIGGWVPTRLWSVPKRWHIKFRRRGITHKKSIQPNLFPFPPSPDRIWGPPSLLCTEYSR